MLTFKKELEAILFALRNSQWAGTGVEMQNVICEYEHLKRAGETSTRTRKASLQIFHASRAIDSFLAHIVRQEYGRRNEAPPQHLTLGGSWHYIQGTTIGGSRFVYCIHDVTHITDDRNIYLHQANRFPTDGHLQQ